MSPHHPLRLLPPIAPNPIRLPVIRTPPSTQVWPAEPTARPPGAAPWPGHPLPLAREDAHLIKVAFSGDSRTTRDAALGAPASPSIPGWGGCSSPPGPRWDPAPPSSWRAPPPSTHAAVLSRHVSASFPHSLLGPPCLWPQDRVRWGITGPTDRVDKEQTRSIMSPKPPASSPEVRAITEPSPRTT